MPPRSFPNDTEDAPGRKPKQGAAPDRHDDTLPSAAALLEASGSAFWRTKTLDDLTQREWESLCDGCGRCCLVKLEDEDTGKILRTDIACRLLDVGTCRCLSYDTRQRKVHDCIKLTPASVRDIPWLPSTCAYRLMREGKPLPAWHPLVSGSPDSVHEAGISVRGRTGGCERTVKLRDYVDHIVADEE